MRERENAQIWEEAMEDPEVENARLGEMRMKEFTKSWKSEKDPWFMRLAFYVAKKTSKK